MATRASLEAHRLQWRPRWRLGPARWAGRSDSCPRPRRWAAPAPCRAARTEPSLISLLGQVQAGSVTVEQAAARLQALASGLQQVRRRAAHPSILRIPSPHVWCLTYVFVVSRTPGPGLRGPRQPEGGAHGLPRGRVGPGQDSRADMRDYGGPEVCCTLNAAVACYCTCSLRYLLGR